MSLVHISQSSVTRMSHMRIQALIQQKSYAATQQVLASHMSCLVSLPGCCNMPPVTVVTRSQWDIVHPGEHLTIRPCLLSDCLAELAPRPLKVSNPACRP